MNLLLVLPVSNPDYDLALQSMAWMKELGTKADVLLVVDKKVEQGKIATLRAAVGGLDNDHDLVITRHYGADDRWPVGPNWNFLAGARYVEQFLKRPWLWCEADAVPLRKGWLEELDAAYASSGKPFMGVILKNTKVFGKVWPAHMVGVGVYPPDTATRLKPLDLETPRMAWDIIGGHLITPQAHSTRKIVHVWGESGLAPVFAEARVRGCNRNVLTLDQIPKDCVLWHRCKDGSLQKLLRRNRSLQCFA